MGTKKAKPPDLWTPVVAKDKQHNNFRVLSAGRSQGCRDVISSWAANFHDRDGKCVREFQTTFDSTFWELYLFACFSQLKLSPKTDHAAPDFMLKIGKSEVAVEATVAKEAEGHRPEWDKLDLIRSGDVVELAHRLRYTTVRLANSFTSKVSAYRQKYAVLPHVKGRPFVICIAPFDQPFTFDLAQQAMRRVLYRMDGPIFTRDRKTGEAIVLGMSEMESVTKDTGIDVPLGMFCDASYPEVSAVVFSTLATSGKVRALSLDPENDTTFYATRYNAFGTIPISIAAKKPHYVETLLDGLKVCLNPFATNPIDIKPFMNREITMESWDRERSVYVDEAPHECLLSRFTATWRVVPHVSGPPMSSPKGYKEIGIPAWPEGELRAVPVVMWPAVDQHMAHMDGWTVVVFRDAVDDAWEAMAVHAIVHSVPEFRLKNDDESITTIMAVNDYSSCDEAFAAIKHAIKTGKPAHRRKKKR
jgi:hypothetical protein